jgi:hypothetical protein
LLVTVFLISLLLYWLSPNKSVARVLFFPEAKEVWVPGESRLVGERRFLPWRRTPEGSASLLVEDMLLGPVNPSLARITPQGTRLLSWVAADRAIYLNLSNEMLEQGSDAVMPLHEQLRALANTVLFNLRGFNQAFVLIDGQQPELVFAQTGEHPTPLTHADIIDGITYSSSMFR